MSIWRKSFHVMIRMRTIRPLVCVSPYPELAFQPARGRFVGDELQHLQVLVPLAVAQRRNSHVVPRHREKIRVYEMKIVAGNASRKVVPDTECQTEPVKAIGRKIGQIAAPER